MDENDTAVRLAGSERPKQVKASSGVRTVQSLLCLERASIVQ